MGDKISDIYAINYPLRLKYTSYNGDVVKLSTYLGLDYIEGTLPVYLTFGSDYRNTESLYIGRVPDVSNSDIEIVKNQKGFLSDDITSKIKELVEEFSGDYIKLVKDSNSEPYRKQLKSYGRLVDIIKSKVSTFNNHALLASGGILSGIYLGSKYLGNVINTDLAFYLLVIVAISFFVFLFRISESYYIKINNVIPSFYAFYFYIVSYSILYISLLREDNLKITIGFGIFFLYSFLFILDYVFTWLRFANKEEIPFWTDFISYHFLWRF